MLENLSEVLVHAAVRYGDRTALVIEDRSFSFSELNELSDRFAHALVELGVGVGDRVTLYAPNSWEWIVSYYGALKTGAVINPLNVMLTPDEVKFVANDCGSKVLIANREKGVPVLDIVGDTPIEHVVIFDDAPPAGALRFDDLLNGASAPFERVAVPPASMSTIGYTSGTTGHPKGAMLSHRSIVLNTAMTAQMHVRTASDTVVSALPCAHVYGNVIMNGAFMYGMKLVLHSRFEPMPVLRSIQDHRATLFEGVPTMYMYVLAEPGLSSFDLSSLQRCTVGGQTMPVAKMKQTEARFGCPLIDLWGMTEIGGLGTTHPLYGPNRHGSIGLALPFNEVRIADVDDAKRTLGPDEPGEIMFRGPLVMLGYYGNEAATTATIEPNGWLHTGDVGRMDSDGYVYIVDRKKDMILTAGYNVYPSGDRARPRRPRGSGGRRGRQRARRSQGRAREGLRREEIRSRHVHRRRIGGVLPASASPRTRCRGPCCSSTPLPMTSTGKVMRRELRNTRPMIIETPRSTRGPAALRKREVDRRWGSAARHRAGPVALGASSRYFLTRSPIWRSVTPRRRAASAMLPRVSLSASTISSRSTASTAGLQRALG